jgi:hypothetical protein
MVCSLERRKLPHAARSASERDRVFGAHTLAGGEAIERVDDSLLDLPVQAPPRPRCAPRAHSSRGACAGIHATVFLRTSAGAIRADPVRWRFVGLQSLVQVLRGAYFFPPRIRAPRYLASLGDHQQDDAS